MSAAIERRPARAERERPVPKDVVIGIFQRGGLVVPFDPADGPALAVSPSARSGAQPGDAVVATIVRGGRGGSELRITEVLGPVEAPGIDVQVVARRHALRREFPEEVRIAAARMPRKIPPKEIAARERFDDPAAVTIDGETARDFDDAVAVGDLPGGGFRLFVHVADVSYYVKPGDVIDAEARARGTSVYFPNRVYPMMPERLADDLCSLRPGEDRLVQSVIVDYDRKGEVVGTRFADGVIRSAARLTYTQVAGLIEGSESRAPLPAEIAAMLRRAEALRDLLETRRHARGSIDFDLPAPMILLDVEGAMTGIRIEPRNRAHRMIEEFMLAANESVAGWLSARKVPCLFRVHENPDPLKIEGLEAFARSLSLTLKSGRDGVRPKDIQKLLDDAEGMPAYPVVTQLALRSMKQARYSPEDSGHFGLAAPHYLHFTSPIRRYPDLVAHRALRAARHRAKPAVRGDLEPLADACSKLEREAEAAERELLDWKKVKFLRGREGEVFDGIVTGVARFGVFVQLDGGIAEGLIRVERLGPEWIEFDPVRHELRGSSSGRVWRLGDPLRVRVERVDAVLRRVDLLLVEERPAAREASLSRNRPRKRDNRGRR
ncbi:MAG TPA: VacB/RNase II family 3'-5' exoribonuclease [Candidatus Polarisedimenticolaceae bacterium]|nr:VacB/RNase II family 3'-5' exoribonuclease [Candidatus Polarisedimenticolaceae bacterium]